MGHPLISERDIREVLSAGKHRLEIAADALVTPLAQEYAQANGVELVRRSDQPEAGLMTVAAPSRPEKEPGSAKGGKVAFGADHGGFQLKQVLMQHAQLLGYNVMDLGTSNEEPCDYPDFAYAVAQSVASGEAWRGVMIDGAGIGSCVVANKVPGVRAACCYNEFVARNAREHNDTNVLTLGSRVVGGELCKEILKVWLETWFSGGRHKARVDKITDVERRYLK